MLADPVNSISHIESKLLNLYKEHDKISTKIIELSENISGVISAGNGSKLEKYSFIEKNLTNQLVKTKQIISGFEKICSVSSFKLDVARTKALEQEGIIIINGKRNRTTIKSSLEKISLQLEFFSRKILYTSPFLQQTAPMFVDLSI